MPPFLSQSCPSSSFFVIYCFPLRTTRNKLSSLCPSFLLSPTRPEAVHHFFPGPPRPLDFLSFPAPETDWELASDRGDPTDGEGVEPCDLAFTTGIFDDVAPAVGVASLPVSVCAVLATAVYAAGFFAPFCGVLATAALAAALAGAFSFSGVLALTGAFGWPSWGQLWPPQPDAVGNEEDNALAAADAACPAPEEVHVRKVEGLCSVCAAAGEGSAADHRARRAIADAEILGGLCHKVKDALQVAALEAGGGAQDKCDGRNA